MQRVSEAPLAGGALRGKTPLEGVRGTRRVERRGRLSPEKPRAESRTLFAEAVSRNVRFSTLFKVQGQMKVSGQEAAMTDFHKFI